MNKIYHSSIINRLLYEKNTNSRVCYRVVFPGAFIYYFILILSFLRSTSFKKRQPINILYIPKRKKNSSYLFKKNFRRLIERLEGLRHSRLGNGEADCILCGEVFRFYHHSQKRCGECGKMTCGKCGKEYPLSSHPPQGGTATGHQVCYSPFFKKTWNVVKKKDNSHQIQKSFVYIF